MRRALRHYDIVWSQAADATVTVTEQDRKTLAALDVPSVVIGMPVDITGLAPLASGQSRLLLHELYGIELGTARVGLFVGSAHIPNRNAAADLRSLALSASEDDEGYTSFLSLPAIAPSRSGCAISSHSAALTPLRCGYCMRRPTLC